MSTRTSVLPPASVARIFMGPAISAPAAPDRHLDLAGGAVVPAAGGGDHAHIGGLGQFHVELHVRQRALLEFEPGGERKWILLQNHGERCSAGDVARDFN